MLYNVKEVSKCLGINIHLVYPKAAEIAEDLIKQYSINTGPYYLDHHFWYENIQNPGPMQIYVFISDDNQYVISVGINRETLETSCTYMHHLIRSMLQKNMPTRYHRRNAGCDRTH